MKIGNPIMLRRKFAKSSSSSSSSSNASKQTIPYELPRSNNTTTSSSIRQSRIELFKPITMIITLIFLCCCIVILYFNITLDEKNEMSIKNILSFTSSSSLKTTTEDMKKVLVHNMEQKLQSLPSPLWPQLDLRTAEAIVSGTMVGFQNITEFNFNHTLVTAYYEFESKHTVNEYKKWMIGLFQTSDPMIIFIEPQSKWFDVVTELRQHAPTIIVQMKFDDLVMSTTFTNEFWDYEHSIDLEAKVHKGTGVYKIWNEKLIFLYNAIQLNPFGTKGFAWVDTGYFRQLRDAPEPNTPLVRIDYTKQGVPEEKVLVMHVRNDGLDAPGRVNVAGNMFLGTGDAFLTFYEHYFKTFYDWIAVKNKFIGSDQFVMTETCRRYASGCYPYYAGRFKKWFALSAVVLGRQPLSEISPHYLFLDEEPNDVPAVPEGKRITYCNDRVVPIDDCK